MIHSESGAFHFFIDPSGSGYLKIFDPKKAPDLGIAQYLYYEHMGLSLGTVTYWGRADSFNP